MTAAAELSRSHVEYTAQCRWPWTWPHAKVCKSFFEIEELKVAKPVLGHHRGFLLLGTAEGCVLHRELCARPMVQHYCGTHCLSQLSQQMFAQGLGSLPSV